MDKEALIAELDQARARLNAVLERVAPETTIYPPWHVKQVLDHVAGWDDAVLAALRAHAQGDVPEVTAPRGIDYYNEQTVTTRESLPLEHSRREYEATRELLKQAIRELPEERMEVLMVTPWGAKGSVAGLVKVFIHHELEHADEIEQILNQA